jgi:hypothetical protein
VTVLADSRLSPWCSSIFGMVTEAFDVIYSDSSTERAVVRALGLEGGLGGFFFPTHVYVALYYVDGSALVYSCTPTLNEPLVK